MAIPYVTGPAAIFVGVSGTTPVDPFVGATPVYLGHCESAPRIAWNPQFEPVMNDLAGSRLPYDMLYQGKDAMIIGDLTIWNWLIWDRVRSRPDFNDVPDTNDRFDLGSLMLTEGKCFPLWITYPYVAKAAMAAGGMPAGRHFLATYLVGPDNEDPGTRVNKVHVQFHALRAWDPVTGGHKLSDANMTGVPAVPPTSPLGV